MKNSHRHSPPPPGELGALVRLVQRRWNIPVLAHLYRHSGAKYVTLARQLGVARASLSASLEDLIALGYVRRNPGHGHPMRPEYLLTPAGVAVGAGCLALAEVLRDDADRDLAFRKWTLPLVAAIGGRHRRFNELRTILVVATPRAITLGLKGLLQQRWAARTLIDDYPPAAGYHLRAEGQRILTRVNGLLCT